MLWQNESKKHTLCSARGDRGSNCGTRSANGTGLLVSNAGAVAPGSSAASDEGGDSGVIRAKNLISLLGDYEEHELEVKLQGFRKPDARIKLQATWVLKVSQNRRFGLHELQKVLQNRKIPVASPEIALSGFRQPILLWEWWNQIGHLPCKMIP